MECIARKRKHDEEVATHNGRRLTFGGKPFICPVRANSPGEPSLTFVYRPTEQCESPAKRFAYDRKGPSASPAYLHEAKSQAYGDLQPQSMFTSPSHSAQRSPRWASKSNRPFASSSYYSPPASSSANVLLNRDHTKVCCRRRIALNSEQPAATWNQLDRSGTPSGPALSPNPRALCPVFNSRSSSTSSSVVSAMSPSTRCICNRPKGFIACDDCGYKKAGCKRTRCPQHKWIIQLMDFDCCPKCLSPNIQETAAYRDSEM